MATKAADQMQDPAPIEVPGLAAGPVSPAGISPKVQQVAMESQQSMLNIMRDKYATEKRVPVKVHNDGPVFVQVNGYSFLIRENERVEVPESIAQILDEAGYI
jgi:hypothetical protein